MNERQKLTLLKELGHALIHLTSAEGLASRSDQPVIASECKFLRHSVDYLMNTVRQTQ